MVAAPIRSHAVAAAERLRGEIAQRRWFVDAAALRRVVNDVETATHAGALLSLRDSVIQAAEMARVMDRDAEAADWNQFANLLDAEAETWPR